MQFDALGTWYLLLVALFLPYVTVKSALRLRAGAAIPSRQRQFTTTIVMLALLWFLAIFTAHHEWIDLFRRGGLNAAAVLTALAILALALGTLPLRWKMSSEEQNRRLMRMRPERPSDLGRWFLLSLAAGVAEECAYRGVMFTLFYRMTESWWVAASLSVVAFGAAHATQGWTRSAIVSLLAFGLHVLVWQTDSLYLAIAVHVLYDFGAGMIYIRLGRTLPPVEGEPLPRDREPTRP